MQTDRQIPLQSRARKKAGIWLSLAIAFALHIILVLAPIASQSPPLQSINASLELQLTKNGPTTPADTIEPTPETEAVAAKPEPGPEIPVEQVSTVPNEPAIPVPGEKATQPETTPLVARKLKPDLDTMSEAEKRQLTNSILARQYVTAESSTDHIFGKPLPQHNAGARKDFHYPVRPDMMTMLDRPLPEVPFAYTADLVYFAYDPGVKGDLQRFWDVITPEFGWRTKYGTEVKCILILVVVGCGWK